jgi:hypothetical protein
MITFINKKEEIGWFYDETLPEIIITILEERKLLVMRWLKNNVSSDVWIYNKSLKPYKPVPVQPLFSSSTTTLPVMTITNKGMVTVSSVSGIPTLNGNGMIPTTAWYKHSDQYCFLFENSNDAMLFKLRWA